MASNERPAHWDRVYATKGEDEVSWHEPSPQVSLGLIARTGLRKDAAIVDVGGGLSRLVDGLLEAGYADLAVLDVSGEAIRRLKERLSPGAPVRGIVADIVGWKPDRRYELWHDRAVLHFLVAQEDRAAYREALLAGLSPGGHLIVLTFAPTGPERCSGLPVRRYGAYDLDAFLGPDFLRAEAFTFDHPTPGGQKQRFQAARYRRAGGPPLDVGEYNPG